MLEVLQHQHDIFNGDRLFVSKNRKPISFDDIRNMEAALKTKPQISESQIHVCQPHKTFSHFYMKTKSKVGSRFVKVKKFTGWCELLTNGQIIHDKLNGKFIMNATTKHMLDRAICTLGDIKC